VAEPSNSNVINLMDALRRSAKGERNSAPAPKRKAAAAGRKKAAPKRKVKKAS
jgi:non-homologous end joining protein Ku